MAEKSLTSYTNELDSFATFGSLNRSITDKTARARYRYDTVDREFTRNKLVTSSAGHNWSNSSIGTIDEDFFSIVAITRDIKENISIFTTVSRP